VAHDDASSGEGEEQLWFVAKNSGSYCGSSSLPSCPSLVFFLSFVPLVLFF